MYCFQGNKCHWLTLEAITTVWTDPNNTTHQIRGFLKACDKDDKGPLRQE